MFIVSKILAKIRNLNFYKNLVICEILIQKYGYELKKLILEHSKETNSLLSKYIIANFEVEKKNFIQVCPKEMLDKLKNPITLKKTIQKVG